MITATYTGSYGHRSTVKIDHLINRGEWWGKTWMIEIGISNCGGLFFVVEADSEGDALDEFVDSRYGHLIKVEERDLADIPEEDRVYAGNYGVPVNLDDTWICRCKVNYFAKREG